MIKADVAVIGGGPAGAIAAIVLARAGRKVLLVDRLRTKALKIGESLPAAARPLLRYLGLMSIMSGHDPAYGNRAAWGTSEALITDFIFDPNGLGWHLDRARFDADLRKVARAAGVQALDGWVDSLALDNDGYAFKVGDTTVTAGWLIDATGRPATIARKLGATRRRDDALMAVYNWVPCGEESDGFTLVESAPQGWWYTAKLPTGLRVVAFHTDADNVKSMIRTPQSWRDSLLRTKHVASVSNRFFAVNGLQCAEACGSKLDRWVGDHWLAVGDAAMAFDPLSSQGLFNALYTGMKAGETVHRAIDNDSTAIFDYENRLAAIRAVYIARKAQFYASERRWIDEPFWRRRQIG